jgi:hypothetical protein
MNTLEIVLSERTRDFVDVLVRTSGFRPDRAEHFVREAGTDLIESVRWHWGDSKPETWSAPGNVRDVLSVIHADRIASRLDMPRQRVWVGLRAFVPRALQMADRVWADRTVTIGALQSD